MSKKSWESSSPCTRICSPRPWLLHPLTMLPLRLWPGSKVLIPALNWAPSLVPGVCRTRYEPSISPMTARSSSYTSLLQTQRRQGKSKLGLSTKHNLTSVVEIMCYVLRGDWSCHETLQANSSHPGDDWFNKFLHVSLQNEAVCVDAGFIHNTRNTQRRHMWDQQLKLQVSFRDKSLAEETSWKHKTKRRRNVTRFAEIGVCCMWA